MYPSLHCDELEELTTWWLSGGAGRSDCYRYIYEHLQSCEVCKARAATYGPPSDELAFRFEHGRWSDIIETMPVYIPPEEQAELEVKIEAMV